MLESVTSQRIHEIFPPCGKRPSHSQGVISPFAARVQSETRTFMKLAQKSCPYRAGVLAQDCVLGRDVRAYIASPMGPEGQAVAAGGLATGASPT